MKGWFPPVTSKQTTAQCIAGMGLREAHFWGEGQHVPEKVQLEYKIFPFSHYFIGAGVS